MNELDYRVAIEALENHVAQTRPIYETSKAIDYLKKAHKEALAQPEQESVAMADYMAIVEKYAFLKASQRKPLNNQNPLLVFAKECVLGVYSETELADAAFRAIQAAHGIIKE